MQRNVTEVGEQDSFLAKEKHTGATLRADKFSHCLPRAQVTWVTTLSWKVTLSVAPASGTSMPEQGIHRKESNTDHSV